MIFTRLFLMRAVLFGGIALVPAAASAADGSKKLAEVTLCNPGADAADVFSDSGLKGIDAKLADGSAICAQQTMRLLGVAQGRTYIYWTATYAEKAPEGAQAGANHVVGQIGEMTADGAIRMVYRFGNEGSDEFNPHLVERDGEIFLTLGSPYQIVLVRGDKGFAEIGTNFYYIDAGKVKADLPQGYIAQKPDDEFSYRSEFNAEDLSVSVRAGLASDIFPRLYTKENYDRDTRLRFPLERKGDDLVPGHGEIVDNPDELVGGIGETPLNVSVPKETGSCDLQAYLVDDAPGGVSVRAAPNTAAGVVANLPAVGSKLLPNYDFGAQVDIVGVDKGWFLVENASHPFEMFDPDDPQAGLQPGVGSNQIRAAYRGRGWIEGSRLSVDIQAGDHLRKTPDYGSASTFDLTAGDENNYSTITGFLDCEGDTVKVAVTMADGTRGEGWMDSSDEGGTVLCANQGTTCN